MRGKTKSIIKISKFLFSLFLLLSVFVFSRTDYVEAVNKPINSENPIIVTFSNTKWGYNLIWSFTCENESIGIKVELLDHENFLKFNASEVAETLILSNGTLHSDSGSYRTKYTSNWQVIFSIDQSFNITEAITLDYSASMWITLLFFVFGTPYILFPLSIIVLAIIIVKLQSRRKSKKTSFESIENLEIYGATVIQKTVFCAKCGANNPITSNFCNGCGSKLLKPDK